MIMTSISVETMIMSLFILAINVFSSVSNESLNDGSTSPLMRQVLGWDIRGMLGTAFHICQNLTNGRFKFASRGTFGLYSLPDHAQSLADTLIECQDCVR